MLKIVSNKIRCKFCGDVIQSQSVHQFVQCRCGKCFVDGGLEYVRHGFDGDKPEDVYEDLSVYADENGKVYTAKEAAEMDIPKNPADEIIDKVSEKAPEIFEDVLGEMPKEATPSEIMDEFDSRLGKEYEETIAKRPKQQKNSVYGKTDKE